MISWDCRHFHCCASPILPPKIANYLLRLLTTSSLAPDLHHPPWLPTVAPHRLRIHRLQTAPSLSRTGLLASSDRDDHECSESRCWSLCPWGAFTDHEHRAALQTSTGRPWRSHVRTALLFEAGLISLPLCVTTLSSASSLSDGDFEVDTLLYPPLVYLILRSQI